MVPKQTLRGKERKGRLAQNHVLLQQLQNGQFLMTIPGMWAEILDVKKGSALTFLPGQNGGVEIVPARRAKKSKDEKE